MRSTLSLIAFPALASAIIDYNGTFYTDASCGGSNPYLLKGSGAHDCVTLNTTYTSFKGFEDQPTGYCHILFFSDSNCQTEVTSNDVPQLNGTCGELPKIGSTRGGCWR